jgi:5-methylcytosine-specific restriction endonuclease McrA
MKGEIVSEESLVLRKRFLHICDNNLIATFLLCIFEERQSIESLCADMDGREERTLLFNGNILAKYIYNICSPDEVVEAAHFLATKGFISMWWKDENDKTPRATRLFYAKYNDSYVTAYSKPYAEEQTRIQMEQWKRNEQASPVSTSIEKPRKIKLENKYKTEASRIALQIGRAEKLGLPATLTLEQWITTLDHFNWKCAYCSGRYTVIEHFIPLAHGKGTTKNNCVPACHKCNSQKGTYHPSQIIDMKESIQTVQRYLDTCGSEEL